MKLSTDRWYNREGMPSLLEVLGAKNGQTRFVGGCVRDALLGLPDVDIDLATKLPPQTVLERLTDAGIRAVPTGIAHGTITAVLASGPVEITTLRRDVATDGRRATIAYTDDWKEDAARRDFTINALSADPWSGSVFDYHEGLADLERRRVRFIGDPLTRIAEDHLRILRFFRFQARFGGGQVDEAGLNACTARANDLMALSRERIADELLKLLSLAEPAEAMSMMVGNGILRPVLPEVEQEAVDRLKALIYIEQELGFDPDPVRRLSALLPRNGKVAAAVASRLRLSNRILKRLVAVADASPAEPSILAFEIGRDEAIDCLLLAGDRRAVELRSWERPHLHVTGGTLIELGLHPGPIVARTLQDVQREWAQLGFPEDRSVQHQIASRLVSEALRPGQ